jgi:hypothetical protein
VLQNNGVPLSLHRILAYRLHSIDHFRTHQINKTIRYSPDHDTEIM